MQGMIKPKSIKPDQLIGSKPASNKTKFDDKDAILYALSIGFSKDPLKTADYKYTNEFNEDFTVFPTMGVLFPQGRLVEFLCQHEKMPKFQDYSILHLGQNLRLIKEKLQIDVQYEHERQLVDISDKGKSAFMMFRTKSYSINSKGQRQFAFQNQSTFYFKGLGGFKYQGNGNIKPPVQIPKRNPDYKLVGHTYQDQAFLYRLNFDRNPLHIDPKISKILNFQKPIIHGLASFGTIARVFVQQIFNNNANQLKNLNCNFVGHVYPGETLQILVWKELHNFIFKAIVIQRNTEALKGSFEKRQDAKI